MALFGGVCLGRGVLVTGSGVDMFHPISIESRDRLNEAVLKAYEKFVNKVKKKFLILMMPMMWMR